MDKEMPPFGLYDITEDRQNAIIDTLENEIGVLSQKHKTELIFNIQLTLSDYFEMTKRSKDETAAFYKERIEHHTRILGALDLTEALVRDRLEWLQDPSNNSWIEQFGCSAGEENTFRHNITKDTLENFRNEHRKTLDAYVRWESDFNNSRVKGNHKPEIKLTLFRLLDVYAGLKDTKVSDLKIPYNDSRPVMLFLREVLSSFSKTKREFSVQADEQAKRSPLATTVGGVISAEQKKAKSC